MPCQNYTEIYTNGKTLKERREFVFRGEVKKTLINVCEALINFLALIVSREDILCALKKLGLSIENYEFHSILTSHEKWQKI